LVLGATACIGLLGVFCSAMIYHDTQRRLWKWQRSLLLFYGTSIALGAGRRGHCCSFSDSSAADHRKNF